MNAIMILIRNLPKFYLSLGSQLQDNSVFCKFIETTSVQDDLQNMVVKYYSELILYTTS